MLAGIRKCRIYSFPSSLRFASYCIHQQKLEFPSPQTCKAMLATSLQPDNCTTFLSTEYVLSWGQDTKFPSKSILTSCESYDYQFNEHRCSPYRHCHEESHAGSDQLLVACEQRWLHCSSAQLARLRRCPQASHEPRPSLAEECPARFILSSSRTLRSDTPRP